MNKSTLANYTLLLKYILTEQGGSYDNTPKQMLLTLHLQLTVTDPIAIADTTSDRRQRLIKTKLNYN